MNNIVHVLRWMIRIAGLVALGLGLALWNGTGYDLLSIHQGLGFLISAALLLMAVLGFGQRVSPSLLVLALLWGLAVPAVGSLQGRLLPGDGHWIIEVIHLLLGLGAIALSEIIAGRMARTRPLTPGAA
ncbi:hypothetical protein [Deinococcus sp. QL22]|uniref:hypothetical protein n=1 Tax=Deinococcus sp. QL22 TaxID=2939437 RepID=UPI002016C4BF|nr:hypothetical protein [Deinococcus sp. QL22]UQN08126.1 hypothetical protein M1R55_18745 [Deinococcus sp. QL22]